ncbi:MAG: class I SAM-dependent methyltransferase [Gemmatimonadales bacterium]|nr:MAG: class I SAM-dependent methyltransferase [Gemmatimonadales bacterium]
MDPTLSRLSAELEEGHWWFTARAEILAAVCRELVPGRARVVEVGCGTGNVLGALPDDWDRVGVDMSPDAVDIAAARYPALELSVGRAPDDVRGELIRADLVLFCDVLEHIEGDVETFEAVIREIPSGARVLITVPAWMELWSAHDESHGHFRRYDEARLTRLWRDLPLDTRLVSPFNWRLYPVVRLIRGMGSRAGRTLGPGETDLFLPPRPLNALLRRIFLSEAGAILAALEGRRPPVSRRGVSWLAVLEKR